MSRVNAQSRLRAGLQPKQFQAEQLQMFMTPREIHERWQPLDADRDSSEIEIDPGSSTQKRYANYRQRYDSAFNRQAANWEAGGMQGSQPAYNPLPEPESTWEEITETDDELWDRKLTESQYPGRYYKAHHGAGSGQRFDNTEHFMDMVEETAGYPTYRPGHTETFQDQQGAWYDRKVNEYRATEAKSLYDSIAEEGVRSPVRLGTEKGSMGKPQVVGGHHRLAAQTDLDPDRLVPVLHHKNIQEARSDRTQRGWKYS